MKRLLLVGVAVAVTIFLLATAGTSFPGTDDQAVSAIQEQSPEYDPWLSPVWVPWETTEAILFAFQGGIGAIVLGYFLNQLRTNDVPDT
ncbi:MAG: energy-coupling factor ABC transporter substrate-binding protein [Natronomonas sp.]